MIVKEAKQHAVFGLIRFVERRLADFTIDAIRSLGNATLRVITKKQTTRILRRLCDFVFLQIAKWLACVK